MKCRPLKNAEGTGLRSDKAAHVNQLDLTNRLVGMGVFHFGVYARAADRSWIRHNHRAMLWFIRGLGAERPTSYLQFWQNCIAC